MIITGVALTVLLVLVVGIAVARKVDGDSANYLVAGRQLGVPLVAVALTTAAVDSNATIGNTDMSSGFGFWAGASLALGLAICLLLAGLFLAKPMNRMGLLTLGDFFARRYNRPVELTSSVLMVFAFTILLAGNLVAMGFLVEYFTGLPYVVGVVLAVCLVLAYTVGGGLFSDAYTAVIQAAITVVATITLFVWVASSYGIVIPEGMGPFDLGQLTDPAQGAAINWATLISLGIGDLVAIDFMQRIFGAKTPEAAQKSCFIGAGATAVIGVLWSLIALTASSQLGLSADEAPIMYQLLDDHAPVILAILVLSGIVAASFSTASGAILATSAVAVRNIAGVRREVAPGHQDPLLRWTRVAMLPVVIVGIFLAVRVSQTGILLTLAFDLMLACLIAPFLLGLFWRRSTSTAALVGTGVGFVVRMTFLALTPTLYGVPNDLLYVPNDLVTADFDGWATMVAAACGIGAFVVTALVTKSRDDEELDLLSVDRMAEAASEAELAVEPAGARAAVPVVARVQQPVEALEA
jgi:SSS family solute:Na+ symporter